MENKEIIENNRLIAEFMGAKYTENTDIPLNYDQLWLPIHGIVHYKVIGVGYGKTLQYHESWDWLMPVVEKIEELEYDFTIRKHKTELDKEWVYNPFPMYKAENQGRLTNTYKVVIDFIKWYNQQK